MNLLSITLLSQRLQSLSKVFKYQPHLSLNRLLSNRRINSAAFGTYKKNKARILKTYKIESTKITAENLWDRVFATELLKNLNSKSLIADIRLFLDEDNQ